MEKIKVAILDDYQNVAQNFVDLKKLSGQFEIKIFSEPFESEDDAIEQLHKMEAASQRVLGYLDELAMEKPN